MDWLFGTGVALEALLFIALMAAALKMLLISERESRWDWVKFADVVGYAALMIWITRALARLY